MTVTNKTNRDEEEQVEQVAKDVATAVQAGAQRVKVTAVVVNEEDNTVARKSVTVNAGTDAETTARTAVCVVKANTTGRVVAVTVKAAA